jgi:hypothetical protein
MCKRGVDMKTSFRQLQNIASVSKVENLGNERDSKALILNTSCIVIKMVLYELKTYCLEPFK